MLRRACIIAAVIAAAACAPHPPPQAKVNLSGFPPAFRDGYAAGCESATSLFERKDRKRFDEDRQYAAGWKDGLSACRRKSSNSQ